MKLKMFSYISKNKIDTEIQKRIVKGITKKKCWFLMTLYYVRKIFPKH